MPGHKRPFVRACLKGGVRSSFVADEDLGEHFKDREGWQHVIDEGRAAGWLLSMDQVMLQFS